LTNLLYLLRRRFARLPVGSLRAWLDVHVFTGLFGGMLVLFHSAFQVRGSVAAISVGSLVIVLITGIIGRCLYSLCPKPDIERLQHNLTALNVIGPGLGDVLQRRLAQAPLTRLEARASLFSVLRMLPVWRREAHLRRAIFSQTTAQYAAHFSAELKLLGRNIDECRRLAVSEVRAAAASTFLRSWRGLHRFAALLMVLVVALHIGVAWYYGFTWVFT
jgi:dihydropyrimidine dehydrogenase (NAD+) subunit PreT